MSDYRYRGDGAFDTVKAIVLTLGTAAVLYPLYFIVIASVSDPSLVSQGRVVLWPRGLNLEGYRAILRETSIWTGYRNTVVYTAMGTTLNVLLTLLAGYPLSRKDLVGRSAIMFILAFTMFFSGGLIPTYIVVKNLGMLNKLWAMVIPGAVSVYNVIVTRTFFVATVPDELLEAAVMDGCSNTRFFLSVVLPVSKAIVAVMVLFYGVGHWNAFFGALIYLTKRELYPLQLILRNILTQYEMGDEMLADSGNDYARGQRAELIKYGVIIVSSLPVLALYPFVQRYFVRGVLIGSIKG